MSKEAESYPIYLQPLNFEYLSIISSTFYCIAEGYLNSLPIEKAHHRRRDHSPGDSRECCNSASLFNT